MKHRYSALGRDTLLDAVRKQRATDAQLAAWAREVAERIATVTAQMDDALKDRRRIIEAMRLNDWGYDRIASALGITKARAQQLVTSPSSQRPRP